MELSKEFRELCERLWPQLQADCTWDESGRFLEHVQKDIEELSVEEWLVISYVESTALGVNKLSIDISVMWEHEREFFAALTKYGIKEFVAQIPLHFPYVCGPDGEICSAFEMFTTMLANATCDGWFVCGIAERKRPNLNGFSLEYRGV